jgi:ATP synthase F1 delta subunit
MNTNDVILSQKYAQAFFNVYSHTFSDNTAQNLNKWMHFIKENEQILFYLRLTNINPDVKKNALYDVIKSFDLPVTYNKIVDLLINDKRIHILPLVLHDIIFLIYDRDNLMPVTCVVSHEIGNQYLDGIKEIIASQTGSELLCTVRHDPELIAGVKIYSKDILWEYNIKDILSRILCVS